MIAADSRDALAKIRAELSRNYAILQHHADEFAVSPEATALMLLVQAVTYVGDVLLAIDDGKIHR